MSTENSMDQLEKSVGLSSAFPRSSSDLGMHGIEFGEGGMTKIEFVAMNFVKADISRPDSPENFSDQRMSYWIERARAFLKLIDK